VTGFCLGKSVAAFSPVDIQGEAEYFKQLLGKVLNVWVWLDLVEASTLVDSIGSRHGKRVGNLATQDAA